jgi:hypothetical protein
MYTRQLSIFLVAALILSASLPVAVPREAAAEAPCTHSPRSGSTPLNRHSGLNRNVGSTIGGVYGQIARYNVPYIQHALNGAVVDYVMLKTSTGSQYTQFGWAYSNATGAGGASVEVFTETANSSGGVDLRFGAAPAGSSVPYFTILYNYVPGRFTFQLNGAQWLPYGVSGGYNPNAVFTPVSSEITRETIYYNDQMAGDTTLYVGHYDVHFYIGSWQVFNGTTFSQVTSEFGVDPAPGSTPYSGTQFYTWDKRCPN